MAYKTGKRVRIIVPPKDERFSKDEVVRVLHWFASTHLYLVEKMDRTAQTHLKASDIIKV